MNPTKGLNKVCGTCNNYDWKNSKCYVDGHYIGYLEFFEHKCEKWKLSKDYKKGGKFYGKA